MRKRSVGINVRVSVTEKKKVTMFHRRNLPYANHYKQAEERASRKRAVHRCGRRYAAKIILKIKH